MRFLARNTDGDDVQLRLIMHGSPNSIFGLLQEFDLTTSLAPYSIDFTTTPGD